MAEIVGVHGIRGMVKLKVFSDAPEGLPGYAPLCDSEGNPFAVLSVKQHGGVWLAELEGVADRTAAEKLRGTKLYFPREKLPEIRDTNTYYHADLIGLAAQFPDGRDMGRIVAVANFGAGDLLEIKPPQGNSFYVPFTNRNVPEINLENKLAVIDPPEGLL